MISNFNQYYFYFDFPKVKKKKRRTQSGTYRSEDKKIEMTDRETAEMPEESFVSDNVLEVSEISSQDDRNVDGETCTPSIILDSGGESNMESATEVLRESSPRHERRPKLMRQSSVEMQQAVDVQRPLTSDRKKSTSLCIPTEATAGATTEDDTDGETKERPTSFGGLSTDSNTDTWKHSQLEYSEEDQEDFPAATPKILSLEAPSYSSIASKPKPAVFEEENIAEPPKVIEGKCDFRETFVFVDEQETEETDEKDEEGFALALTRKNRRERKISKRLSTSCEDFDDDDEKVIPETKYKMEELEAAETKYYEDLAKEKQTEDKPCEDGIKDQLMTTNDDTDNLVTENKILSLEAPSYSSIASKPKPAVFKEENIAEPPKVIEGKLDFKETFVFVDEKDTEETNEKDEEGFEIALTRKHKRERKSSKRLSTSREDFNENENLTKEVKMRQNDDLIEEKEKKNISTPFLSIEKTRLNNIAKDNFWVNKYLFDDAEENYFLRLKRNPETLMAEDDTKKEDDDDDDKDTKKEDDKNQDFHEAYDGGVDDDEDEDREAEEPNSDYNWSDESTFLKPNIPILKPLTFKMTSSDLKPIHIEEQVSRTAQNLSSVIQQHVTVNSGTVSQSVNQNTSLQVHIVPSLSIPFFPFQSTF